jgi:hypothetical protein
MARPTVQAADARRTDAVSPGAAESAESWGGKTFANSGRFGRLDKPTMTENNTCVLSE